MFNKNKYREFSNYHDADNWGESHYGEWAKEYLARWDESNNDVDGYDNLFSRYCGNDYNQINCFLRGEDVCTNFNLFFKYYPESYQYCKNVSTQIVKDMISAPRIPENIIVYRCVPKVFIKQLINNFHMRIITYDKAFSSTSFRNDIEDGCHRSEDILKLYIKKGTIGIFTPCVAFGGELEILLPPNCGFRIKNILSLLFKRKIHGKTVYECELIAPDEKSILSNLTL